MCDRKYYFLVDELSGPKLLSVDRKCAAVIKKKKNRFCKLTT